MSAVPASTLAADTATHAPEALQPGSQIPLFNGLGLSIQAFVLAIGVWTARPLMVLFCALLLATAGLARAWAFLAPLALRCRFTLSASRGFPGDKVRLAITLDNRKPLPLGWTKAEVEVPAALAPRGARKGALWPGYAGFGTSLGWFERATWECELLCRRRGYYALGPSRWLSGDGFGLYLGERSSRKRQHLVVYPRLYALEELGLPSRHPLGESRDPSLLFEDASRPRGLRDYTPETPFKKIAWGASARTGRWQAKVFEPTASVKLTIFLAVDRFAPEADPALFELGVSTAASLAHHLISQREPVGLLCNGALAQGQGSNAGPIMLGAGRGEGQLDSILENLARLESKSLLSFGDFLEARADSLTEGSTLCVIAQRLEDADVEQLRMLRRHGCGILVLIVGDGPLPVAEGRLACRRIARDVAAQELRA